MGKKSDIAEIDRAIRDLKAESDKLEDALDKVKSGTKESYDIVRAQQEIDTYIGKLNDCKRARQARGEEVDEDELFQSHFGKKFRIGAVIRNIHKRLPTLMEQSKAVRGRSNAAAKNKQKEKSYSSDSDSDNEEKVSKKVPKAKTKKSTSSDSDSDEVTKADVEKAYDECVVLLAELKELCKDLGVEGTLGFRDKLVEMGDTYTRSQNNEEAVKDFSKFKKDIKAKMAEMAKMKKNQPSPTGATGRAGELLQQGAVAWNKIRKESKLTNAKDILIWMDKNPNNEGVKDFYEARTGFIVGEYKVEGGFLGNVEKIISHVDKMSPTKQNQNANAIQKQQKQNTAQTQATLMNQVVERKELDKNYDTVVRPRKK